MYQFHLSIGDWSGDGHGRSEDFTVASNAPVETVREAHYKIPEVTEVDIESICSEYGEDEIDAETVQVLKDMGFQFENSSGMGEGIVNVPEMARLWIFLLQKADPSLKLEIKDDDIPNLQFCLVLMIRADTSVSGVWTLFPIRILRLSMSGNSCGQKTDIRENGYGNYYFFHRIEFGAWQFAKRGFAAQTGGLPICPQGASGCLLQYGF